MLAESSTLDNKIIRQTPGSFKSVWSNSGWILLFGSLLLLLEAPTGARAQTASPSVLTIDEAVATAMKGNHRVQSGILDVSRAEDLV